MKKIFPFILLVVLFASCEKVIDFKAGEVEPKVVLQCVPTADSTFTARVTMSRFFLDDRPYEVVEDAALTLYCNGSPCGTGAYEDGRYAFAYQPQAGDVLELRAEIPGYEPVSATTSVPTQAKVSGYRMLSPTQTDYETLWDLHVEIDDPANERNYYRVSLYTLDSFFLKDTIYQPYFDYETGDYCVDTILPHVDVSYRTPYFTVSDPMLRDATGMDALLGESNYYNFIFTDELFSGQKHDVTLSYSDYYYYGNYGYDEHVSHVYVCVETLSPELYMFEMSVSNDDMDDFGLFSEPAQIYSNVEGGIGLFAARNVKTVELKQQE